MSTNGGACRDMIAVTLPMPGTDPEGTFASHASGRSTYKAQILISIPGQFTLDCSPETN
jgi:hypothetical protein